MLRTKIYIAFSALGVILSLSAFICFFYVFENIEAGIWALCSCIYASLTMALHWHHENLRRLAMNCLGDFGMVGFVSGLGLTLFYLFLELYYKADILPISSSIVIKLVWSFMMMKWAIILHIISKKYLSTYVDDDSEFSENPNIEET